MDDATVAWILRVDHLVYATPDVAMSTDDLEALLGVRAAAGGKHPLWGTHNALLALGEHAYLEICGPDPQAPPPAGARPFGIREGMQPGLASWVARAPGLAQARAAAQRAGVELGEILSGTRRRPDGLTLSWRMTDPRTPRAGGIVPCLIDWGDAPHPARTSPPGCALLGLRAEHPKPESVRPALAALGLALPLSPGPAPALIATLHTPRGEVELR
jgi:hypothetical protein